MQALLDTDCHERSPPGKASRLQRLIGSRCLLCLLLLTPLFVFSGCRCRRSCRPKPVIFCSLPAQVEQSPSVVGSSSPTICQADRRSPEDASGEAAIATLVPAEGVELASMQLPASIRPAADAAALPNRTEEATGLSLERAVSLALERNPALATVRATGPVARATYQVAQVYPWNPQFQTQILPYSRDADGTRGITSQQHVLVQTFEWGGQQRYREGAAAANWRQVSGTIRQAELTTAAQTITLYFAALYQRELRDMNRTVAEANEQLVGVTQRRQKAGLANVSDAALAKLQSESARRQERLAEASYQTALMTLRNQLDFDASARLTLESDWLQWEWRSLDNLTGPTAATTSPEDMNKLHPTTSDHGDSLALSENEAFLRELVRDRPDVAAARAGVSAAMQNLQLTKAMKRPNVQTGPLWQIDQAATQFWGFQAQVNIPVVNTGNALVAQAFAQLRLQKTTAEQLENQAVLAARAAIQRYERARALVVESQGDSSRPAAELLSPFEEQFKAGQITLLQVYAARAALVQARQSYIALVNELAMASAGVTQATGMPPQLMVGEPAPNSEPLKEPFEELPRP